MSNESNVKFLHNNWLRSQDRKEHMRRVEEAEKLGQPRPRIPRHIRAKYTVAYSDLSDPCPTTYNRMVPKEDDDGNVIHNDRGEVEFKRQNLPKSKWGVVRSIRDSFRTNSQDCGVKAFNANAASDRNKKKRSKQKGRKAEVVTKGVG